MEPFESRDSSVSNGKLPAKLRSASGARAKRPSLSSASPSPKSVTRGEFPAFVATLAKHMPRLTAGFETVSKEVARARTARLAFQGRLALAALVVVLAIIATAAWLTHDGKLDGSTFGFLLGVVVGYVLTFVRDAVMPPKEPA
jgi:lipopolysaccharide export LptBFGC system permease protein LptF